MFPKLFKGILPLLLVASCHQGEQKQFLSDKNTDQLSSPQDPQQIKIPVSTSTSVTDSGMVPIKTAERIDWDKKIIKTASLKVEVKNFKAYNENVRDIVRGAGGYIAGEEQNSQPDRTETNITIKVPVAAFDGVMNQLASGDLAVQERKVTTEDVSDELIDTKSRLEAKKEMRLKYLEFLRQSKNMAEALQVQGEVNSIQEEIESAAGRIQYLTQKAAYSTISLNFFQPLAGFQPNDAEPSFFSKLGNSFSAGMHWVGELMLALISVWPLILLICGLYFWLRTKKISKHARGNQ